MSEAQILHFFGGKGGAGKTTLSTAFALNLSERFPKDKVLLVSLDPVRSLSDLMKKKLGPTASKLAAGKGEGGLFAAELEPSSLVEPFLKRYGGAISQLAQKGALLTQEDLQTIVSQSLPGIEELLSVMQLADWLEAKAFDRIVVDGPATSHVLRLFELPVAFKRFLSIARNEKGAKGKGPKAPEAVEELSARLDRALSLVRDPARTSFHLTALAEPVPEAQTRLLFTALREKGVPIEDVIVNQVEDRSGCPACHGRRGLQAPHVRKYQQLDKAVPVQLLAKREAAPRGLEAVKKLAKEWASGKETKALEFSAAEGPPALVRAPSMPPIAAPPLPPTRLIFFVGQGGVGKSSCAAAAAVTLTEKEGPVLLISTDPAHSLSDVLLSRLTDTETQVKGTKGLYARELEIAGWFSSLKRRLKEKAEKVFGPEVKGQEVPCDRELLRNLLEAAPAGTDELAAMSVLTDALVQERFKRIVVDPSPAGTTVRLLELPEVARGWLTALLGVLVKYRSKGMGELADEVAAMLKHVKRFEEALASPAESRFVVVTRGEELAAARTERLVEYLKGKKLAVERVLVNRVLPKSTCPRCDNRRKIELAAAKAIEKKLGLPVTVAPALGRHPAGLRELKAFRTAWYALSATAAKIKAA
ncbi:MAG: TRC40/GET3/ArsA family transport-energizing ATPase [Myxococcales bacterium]|nr:TRC40/GET3/ArsA family transport-energizing ATPase [Myxococcales bacterium]